MYWTLQNLNSKMPMNKGQKDLEIHAIEVLEDNIIWVWVSGNKAVVVDPSITLPVVQWLKKKQLELIAVLQTHHHDDHTGGTKGLLQIWPNAEIIASKDDINRIPLQTISVKDKDKISLLGRTIEVLEVPGHTSNHLAYFIPSIKDDLTIPVLFSGDTLFAAGCGKLFEGTAKDMYTSLKKLSSLPDNTKVYCAHEYTESNLRWAHSASPKDLIIKKRLNEVIKTRAANQITLPSTIKTEKETNLFLRAKSIEQFSNLRERKDSWKP